MPHLRNRRVAQHLKKMAKLWPVVGVLGPRQSGKTTLLERILALKNTVFLDDFRVRSEARQSPQTFVDRLELPVLIDEVQKAPELFDALKHRIDRKRRPGAYYLTGSASFSSRLGIRESLTGRIGLVELSPLSLSELQELPPLRVPPLPLGETRFDSGTIAKSFAAGGMPIPAFLRDPEQRRLYWDTWLDTTLHRDLALVLRKSYDPDFSLKIIDKMASLMREGELPTLKHFPWPARKLRNTLSAMEEIFLVRRITPHERAIGTDCWIFFDSGLAAHLMGTTLEDGATLSLARHFLWNEWHVGGESTGHRIRRVYFKSARSSPIDAVIQGSPVRILGSEASATRRLRIEERPVLGAMKALGAKTGYLVAPVQSAYLPPKKGGIGVLPWGAWS